MRPALWFVLLLGLFAIPLSGQQQDKNPNPFSVPKFEVFAGYSYLGKKGSKDWSPVFSRPLPFQRSEWKNAHGWALGLTYNFHKHIGIATDLSTQYRRVFESSETIDGKLLGFDRDFRATVQLLAGPRFSLRSGRVTQFGHVMLGGFRDAPSSRGADFAMGFGGGVDVGLTKRFSLRAFQADFVPVKQNYIWDRHLRLQSGVVLNFGR